MTTSFRYSTASPFPPTTLLLPALLRMLSSSSSTSLSRSMFVCSVCLDGTSAVCVADACVLCVRVLCQCVHIVGYIKGISMCDQAMTMLTCFRVFLFLFVFACASRALSAFLGWRMLGEKRTGWPVGSPLTSKVRVRYFFTVHFSFFSCSLPRREEGRVRPVLSRKAQES